MTIEEEEYKVQSRYAPDSTIYPSLVKPNNMPLNLEPIHVEPLAPAPTWDETIAANFRQYNDVYRLSKYAYDYGNPFKERTTREQGYNPIEEGILDGIPEQFHLPILMHDTREDALVARQNVLQEIKDMEIMESSGTLLNMVSSLGATLASPTTAISAATTIKYLEPGQGFFLNAINTAKTVGPAIAMQNLAVTMTKETGDLKDWAYQTLFDSFVASSIGGLLGRFASKNAAKELDNAQAFFKAAEEDIAIKYQVTPQGEIEKMVAIPRNNGVGAAQVQLVQDMLDSGQVSFKNNRLVKTALSWGSPVIEGVTNRFDLVRKLTSEMFPNVFELAGGKLELIRGPDIYSWSKQWFSTMEQINIFETAMWQQHIGVQGVAKGARAEVGAWTGKWMSRQEFSERVAMAYRRNGGSAIAEVNEVAAMYKKELYEPLFKELQRVYPNLQEHQFSNITSYLNRSYNKAKITEHPDLFIKDVTDYLTGVNNKIIEYQAPIDNVTHNITQLQEAIKTNKAKLTPAKLEERANLETQLVKVEDELNNLYEPTEAKAKQTTQRLRESLTHERDRIKGALEAETINLEGRLATEAEARRLNEQLAIQKQQLKDLNARLNEDILTGKVDLDMLEGAPLLNAEEVATINELNAPLVAAEKELKAAQKEASKIGTIKHFEYIKKKGKETANLEEIVNKTAEDFRIHGREQTLTNITRTRNRLIKQRDTIRGDIALNKEHFSLQEIGALRAQLREIEDYLSSTRKTYKSVKELLQHEDIAISDFQDLIKSARKGSEKVQREVKSAEVVEFKQTKTQAKERIKKAEEKINKEREALFEKAEKGEIPENLFYRTAKGIELVNPNQTPKLRKILSGEDITDSAHSILDNITQLNEEQLLGRVFDSVVSGGNNPLKSRVFLWNDLKAEPWLNNRMDILSGLYVDQLSKRIYLEDLYSHYGVDRKEGMQGLIGQLKFEHDTLRTKILEKPDTPERVAELNKLNKDLDKATKLLNNYFKIYMGNYVDRSSLAYKVSDGAKKLAAATMLGNLPILQLTEFFTPFFRFMFNEFVEDGLLTMIERMKFLGGKYIEEAGGGNASYIRGGYADMGIGVNRFIGNRVQAMAGYGTQYQPKTLLGRYLDNIATFSQQFSLANLVMDMQEIAVAGASESRLIRILKKLQNAEELNRFEVDVLDRARFNPTAKVGDATLGEIALQQYAKYGQDDGGGFVPNFHLWDNQMAARHFRISVEKMVREVLLKPGPLDIPFAFRDPFVSLFTQFTSYIFAATNNFTIPLLTNPDNQKLFGMVAMMSMGALVDPLRQLAKGGEVETDPTKLAMSAMINGGVFGWPFEGLNRLNAFIDLEQTRFLQSDRIKSKSLTLGPASGLYGMASSFLSATLNGEMNQKDLNKGIRLGLGFSYNWFTRRPIDSVIESFELPKDRQEAKRRKASGE